MLRYNYITILKGGFFMKYVILDERNNDLFTSEFDTKEEATKEARKQFEYLTDSEKTKLVSFCVIESVNPDEEAPDHFDGNIILKLW